MSNYKTIGIIGGMGPAATYDLGMKILENTEASCDQEHIPVLIDCNTRIADRTAAILHEGEDPLPEMIRSAKRLEVAAADFLMMPCNTAHYFYDGVREAVSIPVLHMPRETAAHLRERGIRRAGVLATDGTCQSGIYDRALEDEGIDVVYPSEDMQRIVMSLIYDYVKAGNMDFSSLDINGVIKEMKEKGAEILVLGCTELPIAFDIMSRKGDECGEGEYDERGECKEDDTCDEYNECGGCSKIPSLSALPTIDPTTVLARAAVAAAGGELV